MYSELMCERALISISVPFIQIFLNGLFFVPYEMKATTLRGALQKRKRGEKKKKGANRPEESDCDCQTESIFFTL